MTDVRDDGKKMWAYKGTRSLLAWRLQLASQPAHSVGLHRINGEGKLLNAVAGRAFKRAFVVREESPFRRWLILTAPQEQRQNEAQKILSHLIRRRKL